MDLWGIKILESFWNSGRHFLGPNVESQASLYAVIKLLLQIISKKLNEKLFIDKRDVASRILNGPHSKFVPRANASLLFRQVRPRSTDGVYLCMSVELVC